MKVILFPNHRHPYNLRLGMPTYNGSMRQPGQTDDEYLDWWIATLRRRGNIPTDAPVYIVEEADVPHDHPCNAKCEFFDAWEWRDEGARVNMTKARAMHMDKIRLVRNAELAAKDIPWMKAVEAGNTSAQATIATEKQVLRDIPATFDITTGVSTPELLKARWPTELPDRE